MAVVGFIVEVIGWLRSMLKKVKARFVAILGIKMTFLAIRGDRLKSIFMDMRFAAGDNLMQGMNW